MANDVVDKLKKSVNQGFTNISVKTSSFSEKTKIKTYMNSLHEEVKNIYTSIGEDVYKSLDNNNNDFSFLEPNINLVKQKLHEINELELQLKEIEERDNKILNSVNGSGDLICPNCNSRYSTPVNFCKTCGYNFKDNLNKIDLISCPVCGTQCNKNSKFCSKCGSEIESKSEPVKNEKESYVCTGCGAEYDQPFKFCKRCGAEVKLKQTESAIFVPVQEVTEPVKNEKESYVCTGCGAEYDQPFKFCKRCGMTVRPKQAKEIKLASESVLAEKSGPLISESVKAEEIEIKPLSESEFIDKPESLFNEPIFTDKTEPAVKEGLADETKSVPGPAVEKHEELYVCTGCGAEYDQPFKFCKRCGMAVRPKTFFVKELIPVSEEIEIKPLSDSEFDEKESEPVTEEKIEPVKAEKETFVCTGCGAEYDQPFKFCKRCGMAVRPKAASVPKEKSEPVVIKPIYKEESKSEVIQSVPQKEVFVCTNCGAEYDQPFKFCKQCGAAVKAQKAEIQKESENNSTDQYDTDETVLLSASDVYTCKNCGAQYIHPFQFCKRCGAAAEPEQKNQPESDENETELLVRPERYVCTNCKTEYDQPFNFCKKCGSMVKKM